MKFLEEIINKLAISQRGLAKFLDTDHSHLSRYMSDARSIPAIAQPHLIDLYNILLKLPDSATPKPTKAEKNELKQQAAWCHAQCQPLQKKLTSLQTRYTQAATMLQFLEVYEANNSVISEKKQRWIDEQRYQANRKLTENGWLPQKKLLVQIALLKHEAKQYENVE